MMISNVEDLLTQLETTISQSKRAFMSESKLVNEGECLDYISKIRNILPNELSEARLIKKDANNILAKAEAQAAQIIQEAQAKAQALVDENQIIQEAQARSNEIYQNTYAYLNQITEQTYKNVTMFMDTAEGQLREILQALITSKAQLINQMMTSQQDSRE